jgi:hypothetical protein
MNCEFVILKENIENILKMYKDGALLRRGPKPEKFSLYFDSTVNTITYDILNLRKCKYPETRNTTINWWAGVLGLSNLDILALMALV